MRQPSLRGQMRPYGVPLAVFFLVLGAGIAIGKPGGPFIGQTLGTVHCWYNGSCQEYDLTPGSVCFPGSTNSEPQNCRTADAASQVLQPSLMLSATVNGVNVAGNDVTMHAGDTIVISGTPQNLEGSYFTDFTRAWFFDPVFNNSCSNNDSSNPHAAWTMTCTPKTTGVSNTYVDIYTTANRGTYQSNVLTVTVLPGTSSQASSVISTASSSASSSPVGSSMMVDDSDAAYFGMIPAVAPAPAPSAEHGNVRTVPAGTYAVADWDFSQVQPGKYDVYATWQASSQNDGKVVYTVLQPAKDGTLTTIATATVDQTQPPRADRTDGIVYFQKIAEISFTGLPPLVEVKGVPKSRYSIDAVMLAPPASSSVSSGAASAASSSVAQSSATSATSAPSKAGHLVMQLISASCDFGNALCTGITDTFTVTNTGKGTARNVQIVSGGPPPTADPNTQYTFNDAGFWPTGTDAVKLCGSKGANSCTGIGDLAPGQSVTVLWDYSFPDLNYSVPYHGNAALCLTTAQDILASASNTDNVQGDPSLSRSILCPSSSSSASRAASSQSSVLPVPSITSFSPSSAPAGTTVTIQGTGFAAANNLVIFGHGNGIPATLLDTTHLTFTVPQDSPGTWTVNVQSGNQMSPFKLFVITAASSSKASSAGASSQSSATSSASKATSSSVPSSIAASSAATSSPTQSALAACMSYPVDYQSDFAAADLTGNGKADLVTTNGSRNTISVRLNNGDGTLGSPVDYQTGYSPTKVVTADFNGDGKTDLAVLDSYDGTISIFLNNGDGTFAPKTDYSTGISDPVLMGFGASNELIIVGGEGPSGYPVSELLNNGGTFALASNTPGYVTPDSPISYDASGIIPQLIENFGLKHATYHFGSANLIVGDVNGDGMPDIATADVQDDQTQIQFNNGNGTFSAPVVVKGMAGFMAIADVNGDGKPDLISVSTNDVNVSLNQGNEIFAAPKTYLIDFPSFYPEVGDFNGDGKPDIAVLTNEGAIGTTGDGGRVWVMLNDGKGNLNADCPLSVPPLPTVLDVQLNYPYEGTDLGKVCVGDSVAFTLTVHNDVGAEPYGPNGQIPDGMNATVQLEGEPKILSATPSKGTFDPSTGLWNIGNVKKDETLQFTAIVPQDLSGISASLTFKNPDHRSVETADAAFVESPVCLQSSSASSANSLSSRPLSSVSSSAASSASSQGTLACTSPTVITGMEPTDIAYGDLNGDGLPDMVMTTFDAASSTNEVAVLLNQGNDSFTLDHTYVTKATPGLVSIADVTGDGKPDIIVTTQDRNTDANSIAVLPNQGGGAFGAEIDTSINGTPTWSDDLAAGDFNTDGKTDLAIIVSPTPTEVGKFELYNGNGDGTFALGPVLTADSHTDGVAVGDFNHDGKPDIAITRDNGAAWPSTAYAVEVMLNHGNENFVAGQQFKTGSFLLFASDFDANGTPDLYDAGQLYLANGDGTFGLAMPAGFDSPVVALADLNGDGKADVVTWSSTLSGGSQYTTDITALINQGNESFSAQCMSIQLSAAGNGVLVPSITSLNPSSAPTGTRVTITGANFDPTDNTIHFADSKFDNVPSKDGTHLSFTVPAQTTLPCMSDPKPCATVVRPYTPGPYDVSVAVGSQASKTLTFTVTGASSSSSHNTQSSSTSSQSSALACAAVTTAGKPSSTAIADFNGDGLNDMAVVVQGPNGPNFVQSVAIMSNMGNGSYKQTLTLDSSGSLPLAVASGDFNGDGKVDLAVTNYLPPSVSIYSNDGNGSLKHVGDFPTGIAPYFVTVADLNGDGKLDIVTANPHDNSVSILFGKGDGTFESNVDYPVGKYPLSIAVGDLNGDGKPDLAVTNSQDGTVSILLNQGNNAFANGGVYRTGDTLPDPYRGTSGDDPAAVSIADFDGNGKQDIAVLNQGSDTVSILFNTGSGTFNSPYIIPIGTSSNSIKSMAMVAGDLNGDGFPDLAVTNFTNDGVGSVAVLLNHKNGAFTQIEYPTGKTPINVAIGDLNGDGVPDLAVADNADDSESVLLNNGKGIFASGCGVAPAVACTFPVFNAGIGFTLQTLSADLNGDGNADLVVLHTKIDDGAKSYVWALSVSKSAGDGTFAPPVDYYLGQEDDTNLNGLPPTQIALADLNGDGKLDVVWDGQPGEVVLMNNGDGSFTSSVDPGYLHAGKILEFTGSSAHADFNGDGKPDLVTWANDAENGGSVTIYLNDGSGGYALPSATLTGEYGPAAVGDLNGDGRPDLAVTDYHHSSVVVMLNTGNNAFKEVTYKPGMAPDFVAIGDVNGDGKPDIITTGSSGWTIESTVLLQNKDGTFGCDGSGSSVIGMAPLLLNEDSGVALPAGTPTVKPNPSTASTATNRVVADFNGDGLPDLVTMSTDFWRNSSISLSLNNGMGGFRQATTYSVADSAMAVADLNGDGKPDLILADTNAISVLMNKGDGTFNPKVDYQTGGQPAAVAAGDFNGDGKPDVAFAAADGGAMVLLNNGDGTLAGPWVVSNLYTNYITVADMNGDGKPDIVTGYIDGSISILLNDGTDGRSFLPETIPVAGIVNGIALADLNNDGLPDIIVPVGVSQNQPKQAILLNNGHGTFVQSYQVPALGGVFADLNGDGILDTIDSYAANILQNKPGDTMISFGNGDGTFDTPMDCSAMGGGDVSVADFNGDGKKDIAIGTTIYLGNGDGTFSNGSKSYVCTATSPSSYLAVSSVENYYAPAYDVPAANNNGRFAEGIIDTVVTIENDASVTAKNVYVTAPTTYTADRSAFDTNSWVTPPIFYLLGAVNSSGNLICPGSGTCSVGDVPPHSTMSIGILYADTNPYDVGYFPSSVVPLCAGWSPDIGFTSASQQNGVSMNGQTYACAPPPSSGENIPGLGTMP